MFFTYLNKIKSTLSAMLCICLLAGSFTIAPITHQGKVPQAQALFGIGDIVHDPGNAVFTSISSAANDFLYIKEFSLDGIASGLAKMVLESMTTSILTWINSGFEGSPAFVTDLKQFLLDRADAAAGSFIYNNPDLNFLCSPFQLDVKIALAVSYQQNAHGGLDAQCTLSEVTDNVEGFLNGSFDEGGWASWVEVTQNPVNTPTGAYLAAEAELYARIVDDQGNTVKELDWGKGFLSFKVCSDTQAASGAQKDCSITTPGAVIADQVNKSLGAGQDQLIEADEINEIIGALFAQLAQQAITGVNGLLGLGGSSKYSDNSYGEGGKDSYLDALKKEKKVSDNLVNPIARGIKLEQANAKLQNRIVAIINTAESKLPHRLDEAGECTVSGLPEKLQKARTKALNALVLSASTLTVLSDMDADYEASDDPNELLTLVNQYNQMVQEGFVIGAVDNARTEFYIEYELKEDVKDTGLTIGSLLGGLGNICTPESEEEDTV